ncbi:MAG: hypothetical protein ACP5HU_07215 [Phycisphaerae bacterium]
MSRSTIVFASLLLAVSCVFAPRVAVAGSSPAETQELQLTLHGALFQGDEPGEGDPSLLLWTGRSGGNWDRVWGVARNYNVAYHSGRVAAADTDGDTLSLTLEMRIAGDGWTPGGWATYEVSLAPAAVGDVQYKGVFTGTFKERTVNGTATAHWLPRRQEPKEGYGPVRAGEHPRLLFREQDLPALREKMDTPLGQAALQRMNTAAGLSLKYQLTGEEEYAEQAREMVVAHMADRGNGSKMVRARVWGWRLEQVALAYDMCYDAWDEDFRREVQDYILWASNRIIYSKTLLHKEIQWHMASTYPGTIYYGAAMGALATWGEQGEEPQKPEAPFAVRAEEMSVAPADGYEPGDGVPVVAFDDDEMPREWIYVSGLRPREADHLQQVGGPEQFRPEEGTEVTYQDQAVEFKPMDAECLWNEERYTGGRTKLDLTRAFDREYHSTGYFYTVIRNDRPRWVQLRTDSGAEVYLNGVHLQEEDYVRITPGLYPVLVRIGIGETNPWGVIAMEPRLAEVSASAAAEGIEAVRRTHDLRMGLYQQDHDEWRRTGGADVETTKLFELTRMLMRLNYQQGIGAGGAQGSTSFPMGHEGPNKYATAYRNAFRCDVSPYEDVTHYLPFKMFSRLYRGDGDLMQDLNGEPDLYIRNVYHETRDLTGDFFAATFPLIPRDWQPAALWFWNRHVGAAGAEDAEKLLHRPGRPYDYGDYDTHPLWTFVNYPLDMAPGHPAEVMPLTWSAPQFGHYAFRDGWADDDGFLVRVYAKSFHAGTGTRENAGTFRVMGLGELWSHGPGPAGNFRFGENVVLLPRADINRNACGKVLYAATEPDGSGVVTIDLSDVYAGPSGQGPLYENYGSVRRPAAFAETGLSGLRSIGVDYSGKSGAPCLIAIVDSVSGVGDVEGAERALWAWQLDSGQETAGEGERAGEGMLRWRDVLTEYQPGKVIKEVSRSMETDEGVSVAGNSFTITRPGASLRGTFVTPGDPGLEFAERSIYQITHKYGIRRTFSKAVFADGNGEFFCVVTIQEGEPPQVRVEGEGLDARVHVGERTVRFDGEKVVFE